MEPHDITLEEHAELVLADLDAFAEPEFSEVERHWPASRRFSWLPA